VSSGHQLPVIYRQNVDLACAIFISVRKVATNGNANSNFLLYQVHLQLKHRMWKFIRSESDQWSDWSLRLCRFGKWCMQRRPTAALCRGLVEVDAHLNGIDAAQTAVSLM